MFQSITKRVVITDSLNWFPIDQFKLDLNTPTDDILTAIGILERAVTNIYMPLGNSDMMMETISNKISQNITDVKKLIVENKFENIAPTKAIIDPIVPTTLNRDNITTTMNLRSNNKNKKKAANFVKINDDIPTLEYFNKKSNSNPNNTWYQNKKFDNENSSIQSFMNNIVKINEHRKSKNAIDQYEFHVIRTIISV